MQMERGYCQRWMPKKFHIRNANSMLCDCKVAYSCINYNGTEK